MKERTQRIKKWFSDKKNRHAIFLKEKRRLEREQKEWLKELKVCKVALRILQHAGEETQGKIVWGIEQLVTFAIKDVFKGEDSFDFKMEVHTDKKGTMSIEFFLEKDGERYDPLECCGYGILDVACFALRVAVWSLTVTTRVMIFDEPFKNVSQKYKQRVGQLVGKIAEMCDFQFIIVTHVLELMQPQDTVFVVGQTEVKKESVK